MSKATRADTDPAESRRAVRRDLAARSMRSTRRADRRRRIGMSTTGRRWRRARTRRAAGARWSREAEDHLSLHVLARVVLGPAAVAHVDHVGGDIAGSRVAGQRDRRVVDVEELARASFGTSSTAGPSSAARRRRRGTFDLDGREPVLAREAAVRWLSRKGPSVYSDAGRTRWYGTNSSRWCIARSPDASVDDGAHLVPVEEGAILRLLGGRGVGEQGGGEGKQPGETTHRALRE